MKIRLTILFLFLATSLFGQGFFSVVASKADNPTELIYTPIPDAPSDGTSATLTFTNPGNILNTTGGDTQNKYMDGAWTTFRAFSLTGSVGTYRRMINNDSDVVIGGAAAAFLFNQAGTGTNNYGIYGRYANAPMFFDSVGGNISTAALQSSANASGINADFQNIVNRSGGFGLFANSGGTLSGGTASTVPTSSANYGTINLSFVRTFNNSTEGYYIGSTSNTAYAIHNDLHIDNVISHTAGWDNIQVGNATNFTLTKSTFINGGTADQAAQNALLQVSNAYGSVTDCIFMSAPQGLRISTLKLVFDNNYVEWDSVETNQIISYYGNYNTSSRLMVVPDTIWITNNDFVAHNWTGALLAVYDPNVTIVVANNRISGPTSLFQDFRGGSPTGALIDGGGNTFGASIPTPTFSNFTPTDWEGHGLLTEITNYLKGRGFRTP